MRRAGILGVSILAGLLLLSAALAAETGGENQDWRAEFEAVCSQTDASANLANEELERLIARCDKLAERLGAEADVVRRVYLRRLQSCRELFAFVLDSRKARAAEAPQEPPRTPAGTGPQETTAPPAQVTPPPAGAASPPPEDAGATPTAGAAAP